MNLEFNFIVVALIGTAVVALAIAIFGWRRREMGDWALSFAVLALMMGIWSGAYSLEVASQSLEAKIFWAKIEYVGIVTVPVAWFVFAMQYTGRTGWGSPRRLVILAIIPCLTLLFVFTNELHGLIWTETGLDSSGPIPVLDTTYGFWFWIHSAYSYIMIISGTAVIIQAYVRYPKAYRRQNASLAAGAILPLITNAIVLSGILPLPPLDYTTFAFAFSILLIANAIFRYELFSVVPVARRTAVEKMRDGLIVLDAKNRIIDINPAALALFQQDMSEIVGRPLRDFLQRQPNILESFRNTIETETEIAVTIGEQLHYFALHISPLLDQRQNVNGRLIVFYDVTTRKVAEQELARARDEALEASRFKSELLARVSHELRTPLNVILGYTEMMQEGLFGPLSPQQWPPTQKIVESVEFLARQVNELLDVAKLEVSQITLHEREFAIAEVVQRVHEKMFVLAEAKKLTLSSEVQPTVPRLFWGDPDRIEQVLLNLVGNGIKFSRVGVVKQSVWMSDDFSGSASGKASLVIQVSDQGIGIPADMQTTIFEPFKQVDGSLTRMHAGTGLGLAIAKQLTELMNGTIEVQSKVGEGTTFTIYLPLTAVSEREVI